MRLMLSQHSLIHIPPETECLPRLIATHQGVEFKIGSQEALNTYISFKKAFLAQGWNKFPDINDINDWLEDRFTIGQLYLAVLKAHANKCGKKDVLWVGDNTPAYILSLGMLAEEFPEAKFIHMVRDVRDIVVSIANAPFKSCFNVDSCVAEWGERMLHGISAEKWLGNERLITIRYEDLVSNTSITLAKLCRFLGVEYDSKMLDYYLSADAAAIAMQSHHSNTVRPVSTESIGRYKKILHRSEIDRITNLAYSPLKAFGYEVTSPMMLPRTNLYKYRKFASNYLMLLFSRGMTLLKQSFIKKGNVR